MAFSNKVYDKLKWVAMYLLPAMATLYISLAKIWGLPYGSEIGATISAIDLFLGVLLGISKMNYGGEGTLTVNADDPDKDVYNLELNVDPSELPNMKSVTFVVDNEKK